MEIFQELFDYAKNTLSAAFTEKVITIDGREKIHGVLVPRTHNWTDLTSAVDEREKKLYDLNEARGLGPYQIKDRQSAETLQGFCDLVNRHKGRTTAIFGTAAQSPALVAVIDYHGESDGQNGPLSRWKNHLVSYQFPLSRALRNWRAMSDWMDKRDFLASAERRLLDLYDPADAPSMAHLAAHSPVVFNVFQRLVRSKAMPRDARDALKLDGVFGSPADLLQGARAMGACTTEKLTEEAGEFGEITVRYEKQATIQNASISRFYLLDIPVFEGDERTSLLPVRLDVFIDESKLRFKFELLGLEQVVDAAFVQACAEVHLRTGLSPYRATL